MIGILPAGFVAHRQGGSWTMRYIDTPPDLRSSLQSVDATSSTCAGAKLWPPERPYRAITLMTRRHSSLRPSCTRSM